MLTRPTPPTPTGASRPYRGVSLENRRALRQRRLILAAIKIYGEIGFRRTSVKAVCAEAGLTERYFYESYGNGEQLLLAAYHAVIEGLLTELTGAAQQKSANKTEHARRMLYAYFALLKREPAAARLILIEIRGVSEAATQAYTAALHGIAQRLAADLSIQSNEEHQLLALGVVGGISLIALHWIEQGHVQPIDTVVNVALQLASELLGSETPKPNK